MKPHQRIAAERKKQGLTQDELAELTNLTVRTIQRIENGESIPRSFTLKAIATALNKPFDFFLADEKEVRPRQEDAVHSLQLINLSCFLYIIVPLIHFLLPVYLLKISRQLTQPMIDFGRRIIRQQVYWVIAINLLMLLVLAYNLLWASAAERGYLINYLWPFFGMYLLNAILIISNAIRIKKRFTANQSQTADLQFLTGK